MHPVRVLHQFVSVVLVESGQVRRPGRTPAGIPLYRRFARRGGFRPARQPGRPVSPLSLPGDPELRGRLPQGAQPGRGDRAHQDAARETPCLKSPLPLSPDGGKPLLLRGTEDPRAGERANVMSHKRTPTFHVLKHMKDRMPKATRWAGVAVAACSNSISCWVAFGPRTALHFSLARLPRWRGC